MFCAAAAGVSWRVGLADFGCVERNQEYKYIGCFSGLLLLCVLCLELKGVSVSVQVWRNRFLMIEACGRNNNV